MCEHIKKYSNNEYLEEDNTYCIKIPRIRGHKYGETGEASDFYSIISNDEKFVNIDTIGIYKDLVKDDRRSNFVYYIPFTSKKDLQSFIKYLQTDFARTSLYLLKVSQNITSGKITRFIPWFDFSDPIFDGSPKEIDDALFKKFNISDEIRKHIEEILPDYYGIRQ